MKILFLFAFIFFNAHPAFSQESRPLGSDGRLWLEGDSSLHPYSSEAKMLEAKIAFVPAQGGSVLQRKLEIALKGKSLRKFELTIPVEEIKSDKKGLDKKMAEALKAQENPNIFFKLSSYETYKTIPEKNTFLVLIYGLLTVAGQQRAIDVEAEIEPTKEMIYVRGKKELLMTDFGIKPPTAMMGMLKTKPRVVIHFELKLVNQ